MLGGLQDETPGSNVSSDYIQGHKSKIQNSKYVKIDRKRKLDRNKMTVFL
jgi:hypothetical protein